MSNQTINPSEGAATGEQVESRPTVTACSILYDYNPILVGEMKGLIDAATGEGGRALLRDLLIDAAKEIYEQAKGR